MNKLISFLLIFSLLFPQEVCEGECYTDEEAQNIELYIQELEQKDSINVKIIENTKKELKDIIHLIFFFLKMNGFCLRMSAIKSIYILMHQREKSVSLMSPMIGRVVIGFLLFCEN